MSKIRPLKRFINKFLLCAMILSLAALPGCKKESSEAKKHDYVRNRLIEIMKTPDIPIEVKKRAQFTMSQWVNGAIDREPILIEACLGRAIGYEQVYLALIIFDEDQDVVGFVVREECTDANGTKTKLEEDYPAYIHCLPFEVLDSHIVSIKIRDKHQQKDEQLWNEYVNTEFEQLVKEYICNSDSFSIESSYQGEFWEDTLPPVWVSVPEPNGVDVWIWVYDRAGNKSEAVKLLNFLEE